MSGSDERARAYMRYVEPKMRLGELLVDRGVITEQQLQHALDVQARKGGKLAEVLIRLDHIDYEALENVIATQPGVATLDLNRYSLSRDWCHLIPEEFAAKNLVFPIDRLGNTLTVGMAVPLDSATVDAVREMTGMRIKVFYCKPDAIQTAIKRYYRSFQEIDWAELLNLHSRKTRRKKKSAEEAAPDE